MNYQIKLILKNFFFYLVHIHYFFMPEMRCVIRGTIRQGAVRQGNVFKVLLKVLSECFIFPCDKKLFSRANISIIRKIIKKSNQIFDVVPESSVQVHLFFIPHSLVSSTVLGFFVVLQALNRIQDVLIGEFG